MANWSSLSDPDRRSLVRRRRNDVKRMTPKEFRQAGYLQELNRCFLHPLGLALEVVVNADGTEHFNGLWDCRDDPEGIVYSPSELDTEAAKRIYDEREKKRRVRLAAFGFDMQPVPQPPREVEEEED
jgi:hypothetical protein